ncbi:hypothetical protein WMF38_57555 [Sorangium sp. So ce118]
MAKSSKIQWRVTVTDFATGAETFAKVRADGPVDAMNLHLQAMRSQGLVGDSVKHMPEASAYWRDGNGPGYDAHVGPGGITESGWPNVTHRLYVRPESIY